MLEQAAAIPFDQCINPAERDGSEPVSEDTNHKIAMAYMPLARKSANSSAGNSRPNNSPRSQSSNAVCRWYSGLRPESVSSTRPKTIRPGSTSICVGTRRLRISTSPSGAQSGGSRTHRRYRRGQEYGTGPLGRDGSGHVLCGRTRARALPAV